MLPTLIHALIAGALASPASDPIAAAAALPAMVGGSAVELDPVAEEGPPAPAPSFVATAPGTAAPVTATDPPPAGSGSPIAQGPETAQPVTQPPQATAPQPAQPPQTAQPAMPAPPPPPPPGPPPSNLLPPGDTPPPSPDSALEQGARWRPRF